MFVICNTPISNFSETLNFQVAEFANIRKQLEVLEDRLDTMVQPRLTDALSNRKVKCFQNWFTLVAFMLFAWLLYLFALGSYTCKFLQLFLPFLDLQVDVAQDLRGTLIRIGRFKSLEQQYTKVHLKPIKQLWEDFESRQRAMKLVSEKNELERISSSQDIQSSLPAVSFSSWLPSFYDELLLYLEQEWKW